MTVTELRKEMMITKKTDKERSKVLGFLLDKSQKIAKEDKNREPIDSDIETAAKALMKQAEQSKVLLMDVDYEMEVLKEFMPKQLSYEDTEKIIKDILTYTEKNQGKIFGEIKKKYSDLKIDMKVASEIVKNLISWIKKSGLI